jgi:hypothetical protein
VAHPPWHLSGELIAAFVARRPGRRGRLPEGLAPLPGPALLVAVSFADSPVGPYIELSLSEPARLGARLGVCVTACAVSTASSRVDYRLNWGLPAERGALAWEVDGPVRRLVWADRGVTIEGRASLLRVPFYVPGRSLQQRSDGPVMVPRRLWGWLGVGRVVVDAPEADPLSWAQGGHPGGVMTGMRMVVDPARSPLGLWSSLRAPLQAPGPGVTASWAEPSAAAARVSPPRAYGSVG